jgi:NitT/TauT family transport system substrate-binding protein
MKVKRKAFLIILFISSCLYAGHMVFAKTVQEKVRIKAIGIPLADHYAAIVAYEKYRHKMKYADFQLRLLPGPKLVRYYFRSEPDADIAFTVCPMVMDMFAEKPDFRWISLIHRDGSALVINKIMNSKVRLAVQKKVRKPDAGVAEAFAAFSREHNHPVHIGVPDPLATHTTVLYKYLKDHKNILNDDCRSGVDAAYKIVAPPKSPGFLKKQSVRNEPAAIEQSLPWPEIVDIGNSGHIAWYSKDVMAWPLGHVECIIIAKDQVIAKKREALKEVIFFIHQAGYDIELARWAGDMDDIIKMIQKHIPKHTAESITQSLRPDLNVINYRNLNIDDNAKGGLRQIMDLAVEAGFLKKKIDIDALADDSFGTQITMKNIIK